MDTQKKCLRYNDMLSNVSNMLIELQEEGSFCDVTIVCQEAQMNAHKVILASSSYFFRSILKRNPHPHPLVYLGGVQFSLLQSLIQFIYEGSVNMEQSEVESFLALGKELGIKGLAADKDLNAQRKDLNGNEPTGCKTQVPASANIREDQITSEDLKGGTSSDHFSGDDRKEARVKRKSANQKEESEITTSSKRHCSSNMKEDQHRKCGEHNTKESSFANIEPPMEEIFNQDQSAVEENGNAGIRDHNEIPFQVVGEPVDWDSSLKEKKSTHHEEIRLIDIGTELNQLGISPARNSNEDDGTKGNGFSFHQNAIGGIVNARGTEVPLPAQPSSYEIHQQKLRREILDGLEQYPNDDDHSIYSDYNPRSECSKTSEAESLTAEDEKKKEAAFAVLTNVDHDWICTLCPRPFTRRQNALRHILTIHDKSEILCDTCNFKFKNLISFARHGCKINGNEHDPTID